VIKKRSRGRALRAEEKPQRGERTLETKVELYLSRKAVMKKARTGLKPTVDSSGWDETMSWRKGRSWDPREIHGF